MTTTGIINFLGIDYLENSFLIFSGSFSFANLVLANAKTIHEHVYVISKLLTFPVFCSRNPEREKKLSKNRFESALQVVLTY